MPERIGFYICHCGINIAYRVRVKDVAAYVAQLPNVAVSRDYLFMCSDPGQELIESDIRAHRLTRVVVASCSPRMHEKTFRGACQRAGLNPYRAFHMVCVREHVSWVTESEDEATEKAKILIGAGILRVVHQTDLTPATFPVCTNTLVVGGGIAGMQAALDIAKAGFKAYLVERQPTVGGHMLQYDKTFPTLDCAACIGTPKMVSVGQSPNIELLTYAQVEEVNGFVGNFTVKVRKKARHVKATCIGCNACAQVCPVEKPNEWDVRTRMRKAIYRPFPQAVPITYTIDKSDRAPCVQSCPAGVNIQGYVTMVREGNYRQAMRLILERIPLPRSIGRICPAPCEKACRRAKMDEPVAIRQLKRFVADQIGRDDIEIPKADPKPPEEKIAVVGAGPTGLSCAYFLSRDGYPVTVFEALPVLGGKLRVGIPDYRLPADALDLDIAMIQKLGVEFVTDHPIGKGHRLEELFTEGYRAVFVATGLNADVPLKIPGEDTEGVVPGGRFLKQINIDGSTQTGQRVAVVGGTAAAVDAARAALRTGAEVTLFYQRVRRGKDLLPAAEEDIKAAGAEGIRIETEARPVAVLTENGKVVGLRCQKMTPSVPKGKSDGARSPGSPASYDVTCDIVVPAVGQRPAADVFEGVKGVKLTVSGTVVVDPDTFQTGRAGLFAGGEVQSGPFAAIRCVAAGREAAVSIDRFVRGVGANAGRPSKSKGSRWEPLPEKAPWLARAKMSEAEPEARKGDFREIELGFPEQEARREAARCLSCGTCCECGLCVEACEAKAIDHVMTDAVEQIEVGSIIVATGFDPLDPTPMRQYGYGTFANVLTNLEFERLSNATGPTGGRILKRDPNDRCKFTEPPQRVAILHCIGSRDKNYHEYCSRTCCMYALKYAHLIKDKCGHHTQVTNFYIDMRCFGKGYEEFFKRVQSEGVRMVRGKAAKIEEKGGWLVVKAEDTLSAAMLDVAVDMVILCTAMEPRATANEVARIFGITIGADGFFLEEHPKLEPVSTATSGVFLAGTCQGPKDIPDTVAQAKGAAAEALALSASGKVSVAPMISFIDPDICIGCQVCIDLCAYSAIEFNPLKGVSEVNEAVCKGCGSCAAYCPSSAAKIRHFTDQQIFAEIDGLLAG
ncbi:MAG: FAD-dependent oxidoreductase [Deltaproteobacteria bacterium]|nr:FAD-dependent oxidoreductase [Deltaproteobacteria bacterium]